LRPMCPIQNAWLKGSLLFFRFFLGGVFVYAGVTKILDPEGLALSIYNYQLLPDIFINPAAILLPWVEAVAGVALVFRWRVGGASLLLTGLLLVFMAALTITLIRGLDISCGCFSSTGDGKVSWLYLGRDFSLFLMGAFIFLCHSRENGRSSGKQG